MRTINNYKIYDESNEQQHAGHRYNPASIILYKKKEYTIGAGTSDHIYVYREDEYLVVLVVNYRMGYAGLEVFDTTSENDANVFLSDSQDLEEMIGKNWDDFSEITIAKRLMGYLYELDDWRK